jgi:cytochrome b subunit of formate dehydrogenase
MQQTRLPTTDGMLVLFHWICAVALIGSIITGLRIGADDQSATVTPLLGSIALQGSVHWLHYIAGLSITAVAAGYAVYLRQARLASRLKVPPGKGRKLLTKPGRPGWRVRNIHLYYLLFALILLLGATGALRYVGISAGGWLRTLHLATAYLLISATVLHILAQFAFGAAAGQAWGARIKNGGIWLLKMLRPKFTPGAGAAR